MNDHPHGCPGGSRITASDNWQIRLDDRQRSIRPDRHGGATAEFAMTIVAMLVILFGVLQTGIMFWRWQGLKSAATEAARCSWLGGTSCPDSASTATYAASVAQSHGLKGVTASNVTVTTGTPLAACGSTTSVVSVAVSCKNPLFIWWGSSVTLTASACYPPGSG